MEQHDFESIIEEIKKQLDSSRQNWLFGAGISFESNIPLMFPLTERVKAIVEAAAKKPKNKEIYNALTSDLLEGCHIEHYLSHIGDLMALADRTKSKSATVGNKIYTKEDLSNLYHAVISAIGDTVRYGYKNDKGGEVIGSATEPIVEIGHHLKFVNAVFSNRSNLMSRSKVTFFTTNYDTLLEDALGLEKFTVIDGFSGGSVAFWNPQHEFQNTNNQPNKCLLYKLHGSIDWQRDSERGLVRVRYGARYLDKTADIMIYPQATKYVETQRDPFAYLFNGFRTCLNSTEDNVLITCGYSFGDEHINAEIEAALNSKNNRTTLIAFLKEYPKDDIRINKTLDSWLQNEQFGNRVYVAGQKGVYYNSTNVIQASSSKDLLWWTFSGLTDFILTGDYE